MQRAASKAALSKLLLGACPRTVISSRRREILCLQVADFTDFSLRYTPVEMTKEAFSDKLLVNSRGKIPFLHVHLELNEHNDGSSMH